MTYQVGPSSDQTLNMHEACMRVRMKREEQTDAYGGFAMSVMHHDDHRCMVVAPPFLLLFLLVPRFAG